MPIRWNTIFTKLFVAFVLVMLPLNALGIWSTFIGSAQMRAEIDKSNQSKLRFHYNHLEFEWSRMDKLITEYANDYEMMSFPTLYPALNGYERSEQMNDIYNKLRQVQQSSPYIEEVVYYVPAAGRKICSLQYISKYEDSELTELLASRGNLQSSTSALGDRLYFTMSVPYRIDSAEPPSFMLAFKLDTRELKRTLDGFSEPGIGGAALIFGDNVVTIASAGLSGLDPASVEGPASAEHSKPPSDQAYQFESGDDRIYAIDNAEFGFRLAEIVPQRTLQKPIEIYKRWLWLISAFSLFVLLMFSYWILRLIHRPLARLTTAFKLVAFGRTDGEISHNRKDDFGIIYSRFNDMLSQQRLLIEDNYIQRIRSQDAELKQLQSQITPHFLYNSLFTIKQMAELEDIDGIKEFAGYLGQYFQYITRNAEQIVPLREEIKHAANYMSLQEIRFAPKVAVIHDAIPDKYGGIPVPRLILQPIIENAFEHGLKNQRGQGGLSLGFEETVEGVAIVVEDNGEELSEERLAWLSEQLRRPIASAGPDTQSEITGMLNVHQRLQIHFGQAFGLFVRRGESGGFRVELRLPFEEGSRDA